MARVFGETKQLFMMEFLKLCRNNILKRIIIVTMTSKGYLDCFDGFNI